jgi:hypothetical protein
MQARSFHPGVSRTPATLAFLSLLWASAYAIDRAPEASLLLRVEPEEVFLVAPRGRQQLAVTGVLEGRAFDLGREATFESESPAIAAVSQAGVVTAGSGGETAIVVRARGLESRARVRVEAPEPREPVSFRREVLPLLTRHGCNSGTCHGTPAGKNGFRLSLRGFDPQADIASITREAGMRRIDRIEPERSLLLLKATAAVPHGGGARFERGSPDHGLLEEWIARGAVDDPEAPALLKLEVEPARRLLEKPAWSQQLRATARFAGAAERDVTHLARFSTEQEATATVSAGGLVEGLQRGEAAITAEYIGRMATAIIGFIEERPGEVADEPSEANYIDRHVFAKLRLLRIAPAPLASDEVFLRRVYLDVIGVLPAPGEARAFLADPSPDKRSRLIDRLLERPEYAEFWGMRWADRLGSNQRFTGKMGAHKLQSWVNAAMARNLREDELARAVLTASGGNYSVPLAGFFRRLRDPASAAESVSQLFLGIRIGCARCHNHPGDRWTQEDHLGLSAFFARLKFKDGPFFHHIYDKEETVYSAREGELTRPGGGTVAPRFLGGEEPELPPGADRRQVLADWLASPENPWFARAAANRIWYHLFGRGIVEPVDDFRVSNPPSNEQLLEALAADFIAHGFDRKHLIRTILRSSAYQLGSRPEPLATGDERFFAHARVRLLGAEQLLDAISSASGVPEPFSGLPLGFRAARLPDGETHHRFLAAFGRPARAMACECERDGESNLLQALELSGASAVDAMIRSDAGRAARLAAAGASPEAILEELFLATLARHPTAEERASLVPRLAAEADPRRLAEDFLWALINSPEFLFQH